MEQPEIKPEVNKEEERRGGGFLPNLLNRAGSGLGGSGTGFGVGSGLLATKAGLIGLVLVGTTVAGGIGVVGYKVFGPGSEQTGGYTSLFAARPKAAPGTGVATSGGGAQEEGSSKSLNYLVQANPDGVGGPAAAKPEEKPAEEAPKPDATASAAAALANNNAPGQGPATKLSGGRFGELSKGSSGSSSASSGGGGSANAARDAAALSAANARLGTLSAGANARASSGRVGRALRGVGGGSALRSLGLVGRDQKGATSSRVAGATYDGGSVGGSAIGGEAMIGGGGKGLGDTGTGSPPAGQPTMGTPSPRFPPIDQNIQGKNVTPWQGVIKTAAAAIALSCLLLFAATKCPPGPQGKLLATGLCIAAMALGAFVLVCAGSLLKNHRQTMQGWMFMIAGAAVNLAAIKALTMMNKTKTGSEPDKKVGETKTTTKTTDPVTGEVKETTKTTDIMEPGKQHTGTMGTEAFQKGENNVFPMMAVLGAVALGTTMAAYLHKPKDGETLNQSQVQQMETDGENYDWKWTRKMWRLDK